MSYDPEIGVRTAVLSGAVAATGIEPFTEGVPAEWKPAILILAFAIGAWLGYIGDMKAHEVKADMKAEGDRIRAEFEAKMEADAETSGEDQKP